MVLDDVEHGTLMQGLREYVMLLPHCGAAQERFEQDYGTEADVNAFIATVNPKRELAEPDERGQAELILQARFSMDDCPKDIEELWMKLRGRPLCGPE